MKKRRDATVSGGDDDDEKPDSLPQESSPVTEEINEAAGFVGALQRLKLSIQYNENRLHAMMTSLEKKGLNANDKLTLALLRGELEVKKGIDDVDARSRSPKSIGSILQQLKDLYRETIYWFGVLHLAFLALLCLLFLG